MYIIGPRLDDPASRKRDPSFLVASLLLFDFGRLIEGAEMTENVPQSDDRKNMRD